MKRLKIIACVDFNTDDMDKEYADIKAQMERVFSDCEIDFSTVVMPDRLQELTYDIFVLDFGGLLAGADELLRYTHRDLIRQIRAHEDRLFIIYSTFTYRDFGDIVADEFPQLITFNVVYHQADDAERRERLFFGLSEKSAVPPRGVHDGLKTPNSFPQQQTGGV